MSRSRIRIVCCLCGKTIPQSSDVYALDEEWQRRFPQMVGILACRKCAVDSNQWRCRAPEGGYVDGHQPTSRKPDCFDSWDHITGEGTHVGMVRLHPWPALLQGAEDYLRRYMARFRNESGEVVDQVRDALDRWDAQPPPGPSQ